MQHRHSLVGSVNREASDSKFRQLLLESVQVSAYLSEVTRTRTGSRRWDSISRQRGSRGAMSQYVTQGRCHAHEARVQDKQVMGGGA